MTWKKVTTCILECPEARWGPNRGPDYWKGRPHTTYVRNQAVTPGDIIECPYCESPAIVKATHIAYRAYSGKHRE